MTGEESGKSAKVIQQEIVEYLLSLVDTKTHFYDILDKKLIPALDDLGEQSFFSANVLFPFMYELIEGLHEKGAIKWPYH